MAGAAHWGEMAKFGAWGGQKDSFVNNLTPVPEESLSFRSAGSSAIGAAAATPVGSGGGLQASFGAGAGGLVGVAKPPAAIGFGAAMGSSATGKAATAGGSGILVTEKNVDISWAVDHSPCGVVCVTAGWLPDDLVESALKRLLVMAREMPTARLLLLDVSFRKEWVRGSGEKPPSVDFLQKLPRDRRDNVRIVVMDATLKPSRLLPGVDVEALPATVVYQGGKMVGEGPIMGFTRKDMQVCCDDVRQIACNNLLDLSSAQYPPYRGVPRDLYMQTLHVPALTPRP